MKNSKIKNGFTLIELLVVISIISLLASVVIVSLGDARQKARDSYRKQTLKEFQNALQLYASDHNNTYPDNGWTAFSGLDSAYGFVPKYLPTKLVDANDGQTSPNCAGATFGFWYGSYDGGRSYKLTSCSEKPTAGDPFSDPNKGRPYSFSVSSNSQIPSGGCSVTNYDTSSPYYVLLWPACW